MMSIANNLAISTFPYYIIVTLCQIVVKLAEKVRVL